MPPIRHEASIDVILHADAGRREILDAIRDAGTNAPGTPARTAIIMDIHG
jgi:hypothetical protein